MQASVVFQLFRGRTARACGQSFYVLVLYMPKLKYIHQTGKKKTHYLTNANCLRRYLRQREDLILQGYDATPVGSRIPAFREAQCFHLEGSIGSGRGFLKTYLSL